MRLRRRCRKLIWWRPLLAALWAISFAAGPVVHEYSHLRRQLSAACGSADDTMVGVNCDGNCTNPHHHHHGPSPGSNCPQCLILKLATASTTLDSVVIESTVICTVMIIVDHPVFRHQNLADDPPRGPPYRV